ncbi:hypothetical protein PInf_007652 [Phytophthora infestans]|nr:hypothetical protein PInf_007651 [Phytophthora infestans]KAI9983587.1 hypothetical protein PInf_007652 [Phytophthora infestans]
MRLNAGVFPAWGLMMAKITVLFFDFTKTEHGHYCFAVASERLIARVRLAACSVMLRQDIGWFDMPENASGVFLARLSSDSTTLLALTSETLNRLMVTVSTLVIVFAVCFYFSWVLTLILLAVASLGMEQELSSKYKELLEVSKRTDTRGGLVSGAAFGFPLGMVLLIAALLFYVSSRWISHGTITFEDMFVMLMVLSLSSFSIGSAAQGATDPKRAQQAAENIFEIIDRVPVIDALSTDGKTFSSVKESLEFRDVQFAYPSREEAQIYRGYDFKITPGQTVALFGASGCGKSTAIALVERVYDPHTGFVA